MASKLVENIYLPIQAVAGDEFTKIIGSARASSILGYSRWLDPLFKRSLPSASLDGFKDRIFLENVPDDPVADSGRIFVLCMDSTWNLEHACTSLVKYPKYNKTLIVFPRVTTLCKAAVNKHNLPNLTLVDLHLDFVPLDNWIFLVPCPRCFARCFIEADITDIYTIARSLCKLQIYLGAPRRVFTIGSMASRVYRLLEEQKTICGKENRNQDATFYDMFIIDRTVDVITPLLTQMTYGGLIDDKFDLHYGYLDLPARIQRPEGVPEGAVLLSDQSDEVFSNSRCLPMADALDYMLKVMEEVRDMPDKLKNTVGTSQWNTNGIRAAKLKEIKPMLALHLNLIQSLTNFSWLERQSLDFEYNLLLQNDVSSKLIIKMLNCGHVVDAIRLLCLYSQLTKGVSSKRYQDFLRRLIGLAGPQAAAEIIKYDKCGLLKLQKGFFAALGSSDFESVSDKFKLVLQKNETKMDADGNVGPADVGAAYDKYVPFLIRLVQTGLQQTQRWQRGGDIRSSLEKLKIEHAIYAPTELGEPPTKKVLVFVVGGVTESEASIFRQMGSILFDDKVEFHIASTNLTSGRRIVAEISPAFEQLSK